MGRTGFLWLEVTGRCQLECVHCYADSGPSGTDGSMTGVDWVRVLDQAAELRVEMVQFIGGEPTLYPDLPALVDHALARGLAVEVFSNLVHITNELWETFSQPRVSLATSYYSDDAAQHAAITRRPTHARTRANIAEAVRRSIPIRAGVIDLGGGQRAQAARPELIELGVPSIGYDRLRHVGRGARDQPASTAQLCGHCADGVAAISPDGTVWPCVFSRWLPIGNVLEAELAEILYGPVAMRVRTELTETFAGREMLACGPDCGPNCNPINCGPRCEPMTPACNPKECRPVNDFCSPNYPGRDRPCDPRTSRCRPQQCRPYR